MDLPQFRTGAMFNLGHRCFNFGLAPIPNWGNVQLGAPVSSILNFPHFKTGPLSNLDHRFFNFGIVPIPNWGNVKLGEPVFQLQTCPNSKLGQCSTWGTSVSTSDLPQFQTGAMSNLGHQCYNFEFAPILKF